jgi:2-methylcitrate dehydratase PrpD
MSDTSRLVADFARGVATSPIPAQAIEKAQLSILDTIGVALAGHGEPGPVALRSTLAWGGSFTVWGEPRSVISRADAALANGIASHALDFDDYNMEMFAHPSAVLVPAILAVAEGRPVSGRQILAAYVAGYEVFAAMGHGMAQAHYKTGFHPTGTLGTLAAAVAVATVLELDRETTVALIAIAASMASGLRCNFGTDTKPLHAGLAAANAVRASELAIAGLTGSADVLDNPAGFAGATGGETARVVAELAALGTRWWILDSPPIIKAYAACGMTHSGIAAAIEIRHGGVDLVQISNISVFTSEQATWPLRYHAAHTGLEGKFCLEYAVAAALVDGSAGVASFTDEAVSRPDVQRLSKLATVTAEDGYTQRVAVHDGTPTRVEIALESGRRVEAEVSDPPGSAENPASPQQIRAKFDECAHGTLGARAAELGDLVMTLESRRAISDLGELLRAPRQRDYVGVRGRPLAGQTAVAE